MSFFLDQIFIDNYPEEVATFCNENGYVMVELEKEDDHRRFQIQTVPAPTTEELAERLRSARDAKLAACDYTMCADVYSSMSTEQQTAWRQYRQALRDLPSQEGFPWDGGGELTPFPEIPA